MWRYRSDILTPLTKMTSKQATWNWTEKRIKTTPLNNFMGRDAFSYL